MLGAQRTTELACIGLAAAVLTAIAGYAVTIDFIVARELTLARWTGYTALGFLVGALAMSPLDRVLSLLRRRPLPMLAALRRALGIASAFSAVVHASIVVATPVGAELPALIYDPLYRAGLTTLVILLLLGLTSYPRIVRALRIKLWKPLHRLVYIAGLVALHHVALSPHASPRFVIALASVLATSLLLRLVPRLSREK